MSETHRPSVMRLVGVAALFAYLALAVVFLHAPLGELDTRIASDRGDPVFVLYLMQWGARQIEQGMPAFWHAPMFHPTRWATTFSDHMLSAAALCLLGERLGVPPLATYDLLVISSFVLGGWMSFWVFRRAGLGSAAAFLGGCFFAFSPYRVHQLPHLAMLLMQWIPPTLWTFDQLLVNPGRRTAAAFLAFYTAHVLGGNYLAYMIHLPLAVLLACRLADRGLRERLRHRLALLSVVAAASATLVLGLFWPYLVAARELGLHRSAKETLGFAASLASYIDSTSHWVSRFLPGGLHRPENGLFPGFVVSTLAVWTLVRLAKTVRTAGGPALEPRRRLALRGCVALGLAGVILGEMLVWRGGPLTHGRRFLPVLLIASATAAWLLLRRRWRVPPRFDWRGIAPWDRGLIAAAAASLVASLGYVFLPAAAILPGLSGMRVPARFSAFVALALAFLAARAIDGIPKRPGRRALILIGIAGLTWIDLHPRTIRWPRLPEAPAVYSRVASDPSVHAVLELPFSFDDPENIVYLQFQTAHWKPIANGYSGFLPPGYGALRERCSPFPGPEALADLASEGVTHIVAHTDLMRRWQRRLFPAWLKASGLRTVERDGPTYLLEVAQDPAGERLGNPP